MSSAPPGAGDLPPRDGDLELPWQATGRLDAAEAARLDAMLAADPELARRLAIAEEERAETIALNETLGVPSAAKRDALFARIESEGGRARSGDGWFARLAARLSDLAPRTLAAGALAAFALIVVQGALLTGALRHGDEGARYTTASAPGAPAAGGTMLLIGFAPVATASDITGLLSGAHASIVSGPRPGGLFEVRIADRVLSDTERDTVIAALRAQTRVVAFVAGETGAP